MTSCFLLSSNNPSIEDKYIGDAAYLPDLIKRYKRECNNPNNQQYMRPLYQFIRSNGGFDEWNFTELDYNAYKDDLVEQYKPTLNQLKSIKPTKVKLLPTPRQKHRKDKYNLWLWFHLRNPKYENKVFNLDPLWKFIEKSNNSILRTITLERLKTCPYLTCISPILNLYCANVNYKLYQIV